MQRLLSILLLVLPGLTAVSPVALAAAQPDRPACCRKDGKHHCALTNQTSTDPSVSAKCPVAPVFAQSGFRIGATGIGLGFSFAQAVTDSNTDPLTDPLLLTTLSRGYPQRGPPAILPN